MTLAERAQGKDSKSEKTRTVTGAFSEPRAQLMMRVPPGGTAVGVFHKSCDV